MKPFPSRLGWEFSIRSLNPKLTDILIYHEQKREVRLVPTREEFVQKFGREPRLLDEALNA